jgi:hypothetical protein
MTSGSIKDEQIHGSIETPYAIMSNPAFLVQKLHAKHPAVINFWSYASFVKAFTQIPRYRQAFITMPKDAFDAVYERHIRQIPDVKEQGKGKLLEEASTF